MSPDLARPKICAEKERLSRLMLDAISELTALQVKHSSNLISGGEGFPRIELAVEAARRNWEKAREVYAAHVRSHCC